MNNSGMITLKNKTTGELVTVPRSQFIEEETNTTPGFAGIGKDVSKSLQTAIPEITKMLFSIPGGINNVGDYATTTNPVSTMANLGAGGVESGAALLSSPQVFARYLAQKFPKVGEAMQRGAMPNSQGINEPTFFEKLNNFERQHGLMPQSEEEKSVRNAGGLLFGGGALKNFPNMLSRTGAITAEQTGRGGDPIHAAIMGVLGDYLGNKIAGKVKKIPAAINRAAGAETPPPGGASGGAEPYGIDWNVNLPESVSWMKNIPQAALNVASEVPQVAKNALRKIPEVAGNTLGSALETAADYGSKIPMAGEILQPTVGALASYLKHKSVPPEEFAKRKLFGDIESNDLPAMQERMDAANRLGLSYLTPAELLQSPFEAAKQGTIGRTPKGSKLIYEKGSERTASEGQAITSLLDSIYDEGILNPERQAAYDETMNGRVPHEFIAKHSKRPVIQEAMDKIQKNSSYRQMMEDELAVPLDKVNPKIFSYWDIVKRVLGDMEESKKDKMGRATTESSQIGKTRREMVREMDEIKPEYETARNISERMFTRRKLQDFFDKKPMTGNNLHKYLSSTKNWEELQHKLREFPEALQKLNDLHLLSRDLIPNDMSVRSAAGLERTGMSSARNKLDALKRELDNKYGQEHDVASVELLTNPDLMSVLQEYLTKKGK
jgi:hypothetical protein